MLTRLPAGKRTSRTDCSDSLVEHGLETLLCKGGALQVFDGSNILSHCNALRVLNWCHAPNHQTRKVRASVIENDDMSDEHGICHLSLSFSIVFESSRRSSFVPTSTMDVLGAWCEISGYHYNTPFRAWRFPSREGEQTLVRTFS